MSQSASQSVCQAINQSVNESMSQSITQSVSQSVSQPVSQSHTQSLINESSYQWVSEDETDRQRDRQTDRQTESHFIHLHRILGQSLKLTVQSINQSSSQHLIPLKLLLIQRLLDTNDFPVFPIFKIDPKGSHHCSK